MKTCPYCGQEYPDDATVCLVDRTPLETDVGGRKILDINLPMESSRPKKSVDLTARPFTVTFAVQLLAAEMVFSLIMEIVRHVWWVHRYPKSHYLSLVFFLEIAWGLGIWGLFLYSIYQGKNWARWVVSCLVVPGIVLAPLVITRHLGWTYCFNALINAVAVIALFQPASNDWYKGKIVSEPVPAS